MNMQEMVLNRIKLAIEESQERGTRGRKTGLAAVEKPDWTANTGLIYAMHDFDTAFVLRYGFFDGYCTLTLSGPAVNAALDESGLRMRTHPKTNVTTWYVEVDGEEYRVENPRSESSIRWHYLEYTEGDKLRAMVNLISWLAREDALAR